MENHFAWFGAAMETVWVTAASNDWVQVMWDAVDATSRSTGPRQNHNLGMAAFFFGISTFSLLVPKDLLYWCNSTNTDASFCAGAAQPLHLRLLRRLFRARKKHGAGAGGMDQQRECLGCPRQAAQGAEIHRQARACKASEARYSIFFNLLALQVQKYKS